MKPYELNVILDRVESLARRAPPLEPLILTATTPPATPPAVVLMPSLQAFVKKLQTINVQNSDMLGDSVFAFGAAIQDHITFAELRAALADLETMGYV